jgi:hypothetical protein
MTIPTKMNNQQLQQHLQQQNPTFDLKIKKEKENFTPTIIYDNDLRFNKNNYKPQSGNPYRPKSFHVDKISCTIS